MICAAEIDVLLFSQVFARTVFLAKTN